MRLIATTVVRESIVGRQRTGYVYDVDWEARGVRRRFPIPEPRYPQTDLNPRGGVRGGRGVVVTRHGIVVANYDTLLRYDDDWNLLEDFSHPLFVGMHEIDWDGGHLWTTSTAIDAVLKVKLDGEVEVAWDPHAPTFASRLGLRKRPHVVDGSVDYRIGDQPLLDRCHINSVSHFDGSMIVNCGLLSKPKPRSVRLLERARAHAQQATRRPEHAKEARPRSGRGLVLRLDGRGTVDVLLELPSVEFPTHNGQLLDDARVALNDSTKNTLRIFRARDAMQLQSIEVPGVWLRGLQPVDASRLFVGSAPASIVLVDLERNRIVDRVQLSEDPNEAVHGLTICPPEDQRR